MLKSRQTCWQSPHLATPTPRQLVGSQGRSEGLAARGYFIPGGASQKGGWSGSGVPCPTLPDTVTS